MVKKNKSNNNNNINIKLTEAQEIISRLKDALNVASDGQLANFLGISRQNIGASRKRGDVPPGWIYKVAELSGCSMDWLRFGKGPKIRVQYSTAGSGHEERVASPQSPYDRRAVAKPGPDNDLPRDGDSSGFGTAVEMLAKIYSSGDSLLISTINANIRAFCEAIESKERDQRSTKELNDLKNRLTTIEKQLQQTKPAAKKARNARH